MYFLYKPLNKMNENILKYGILFSDEPVLVDDEKTVEKLLKCPYFESFVDEIKKKRKYTKKLKPLEEEKVESESLLAEEEQLIQGD